MTAHVDGEGIHRYSDYHENVAPPPSPEQMRATTMADCIVGQMSDTLHAPHTALVHDNVPGDGRALCSSQLLTTLIDRRVMRNQGRLFELQTHELAHHVLSGSGCVPSSHDTAAFRRKHAQIKNEARGCR